MSTFKRIMSFGLAMVMVMGMLPMPHAHAEETEEHEHQVIETVPAATAEAPEETTAAPTGQPEETALQEETEAPTEPTVPATEETVPETEMTVPDEVLDGDIVLDDAVGQIDFSTPVMSETHYGTLGNNDGYRYTINVSVEGILKLTLATTESGHTLFVQDKSGQISPENGLSGRYTPDGSTYEFGWMNYYRVTPGTYYVDVNSSYYDGFGSYRLTIGVFTEKHEHSWRTRKVAPTCTSRGYTEEYCTGCDEYSRYDYVDTIPHNEVKAEREEPTCTKTGKEKGTKCSSCGKTMSGREEIPKLPHDTKVEIPMVEPTCTTVGKTVGAKCSVCGTVSLQPEDIPTLPHTEEDVAYVPATCTATGLTAGTKCSVCDEVVQAQEVVPKLAHTEVNAAGVAATCTKDGKADVKFCTVCEQEVAYTTIPKLGHDAVDYFCLRCGEVDDAVVYEHGDCGDTIQWFGLKDGTMLIRGAGKMWDETDIPTATRYKKIVIEEGVTYIGKRAFYDSYATSVSIPRTVSRIGAEAFAESSLSGTLTIPEGVETITTGVFSKCSSITNVSFPTSLSWISPNAFYECTSLTSVTFPKNLRYIGNYAFYGCKKLAGDLVIPDLVYYLGEYAFCGCVKLEGVAIGDGVNTIGEFAFSSCRNITYAALGDRVKTIEEYAFAYCDNLNAIDLNQVSYVSSYAFANCPMSVGVYLPKRITIDSNAFSGCGVRYVGYSGSRSDRNSYVYIGSGNNSLKNATWGYGYGQSSTPACPNGHSVKTENAQAPTCTEAGWTESESCVNCGAVTKAKIELPALGHKFLTDTGVSPTCTEAGLTTGSHCGHCGLVQTAQEEIPALGHTPKTDAAMAPTCEQRGLTEGSHCDVCQVILVQQEQIPATGHNRAAMPDVPATCYEKGSVGGVHCSVCGRIFELPRKTPLLDHEIEVIPAVAPTCTEDGATEGSRCGYCGEIYEAPQLIPALGHDMISDEEMPPTCTDPGHQAGSHCSRCDYTEGRKEIPALDHMMVLDEAVAPTCTTAGITRGWHCDRCGEVFVEQEIVPTLGHDFVDGICDRCGAPDRADYELFSGKSMTLKVINPETNKAYTSKQLTWTLSDEYAPFATITAAGKLTAKKVVEKTRIEVIGTVTATEEKISYLIDIYPAVTQLEVKHDSEIVNGKTLLMDVSEETLTLKADAYPLDTLENVTWTVSDSKKMLYASYDTEGDTLVISNPTGKAGTVTIKATVDAGVTKTVTVKVQFGSYANTVAIEAPEKTTLRGGESMTLKAAITDPESVTKAGITWSVSDKTAASITASGKLTAKSVAHPTTVTITATSKDGQAYASIDLEIIPKNEGQLVLMENGKFVTNATKALNVGDTYQLSAAVITNGDPLAEEVTWSTANAKVATVENGLVTAVGNGTAKITATAGTVKVTMTVKVSTLAASMEITTKDGKNLIEENGETLVVVSSGKTVTLAANILTQGAAKTVDWAITEGAAYAKIASGKVAANKDLTSVQYVSVKATAKDGSGTSATIRVKILPLATGVQIFQNGTRVRSNTVYVHDMLVSETIKLNAKVYPAKANQGVTLTSSNRKIADFNESGELVCIKPGTVTITATASDGSGQKTTFKLTIVKKITSLTLKEGSNLTVVGGKSLKLAPMVEITPSDATNKKLNWSVAPNEYGIKISASGVLTTRKVTEPVTINIMVTPQDGSGKMLSFNVTVTP